MKLGTKVKVSMGIDHDRTATVVSMNLIKKDGKCIPELDKGHYKPIEKNDVAIRYDDDNTFDVYNRYVLIVVA